MSTDENVKNADLMKDYFCILLNTNGLKTEAGRLTGVVIQNGEDARSIAEIITQMSLPEDKDLRDAKAVLLNKLSAV